jgi:hypothetical protein
VCITFINQCAGLCSWIIGRGHGPLWTSVARSVRKKQGSDSLPGGGTADEELADGKPADEAYRRGTVRLNSSRTEPDPYRTVPRPGRPPVGTRSSEHRVWVGIRSGETATELTGSRAEPLKDPALEAEPVDGGDLEAPREKSHGIGGHGRTPRGPDPGTGW